MLRDRYTSALNYEHGHGRKSFLKASLYLIVVVVDDNTEMC